jgi:hypothetical protein
LVIADVEQWDDATNREEALTLLRELRQSLLNETT